MDITELLTKGLGKPVASFLLKLWLGEPAASIGAGLVDIAASHIQDFGKRREAARHFEGIADRMVIHLKPLFEQAARSGHLNIEAVAHELGTTLEGRISAGFLVERNLDPATLTRALREARPLPSGQFSEVETQLYERALEQTARYLVEAASHLPRFAVASVATQLQRLSHLGDILDKAYESISRMEQLVATSMPGNKSARFEADYREAVSRNVDRLELIGVDVAEEQSRRYELSVAYISLSLREDSKDEDETRLEPAEVVLDGLLPGSGRLLIRGDAGSGKSTLLKWVAWTAARIEEPKRVRDSAAHLLDQAVRSYDLEKSRPDVRDTWRSRIPFLVRLRDCRDGRLPSLDELTQHTTRELGKPPEGWVKSILEDGRGLLLIDGVDEVPHNLRRAIREDIEGLVRTYTRNTYLLTTRPAAVTRDWLKSLGFRAAEVNPLSPVDRDQLIDRWHEAVARQLEQVGRPSTELAELARELKTRLRENPAIARLATNPLLAAAICALHRQRNRRLPETQAELCEDLCKMLLHQREAETPNLAVDPAAYRGLTYPQKKRVVETLAHDMVLNERSVLDRSEVLKKIEKTLGRMGRSEGEAGEVLEGLIERSGMLREMSPGKLDFIHNTFKEYLAAEVFAVERDDRFLAKNALDPGWQQVLVFAAARGEPGFVASLIENVLSEGGEAPAASRRGKGGKRRSGEEERQRSLMAVRLEAAALELRPELRQRVAQLRQELFPPATMAEAEALASAGDTVVPFLRYRGADPARKVAACVRALRLIDSPAARETLKEYMREERWTVLEELARVINPLKLERVRQALLSGGSLSQGLRSQISDLTPLVDSQPSSLQSLDLSGTQVQDLSPLSHFPSLQNLDLSATQVQDLSPLAHLSSLQSLNLGGTQIQDLSPLAHLSSLQSLDLSMTEVQDLLPLSHLSSLQSLDIGKTQVQDLSPLSHLSSLQSLGLRATQVQDLSVLGRLGKLHVFFD